MNSNEINFGMCGDFVELVGTAAMKNWAEFVNDKHTYISVIETVHLSPNCLSVIC